MASLWWRDIFRNFLCAFIGRYDTTQFGVMSSLIRSWIGLESVSGRPTYARYITDLRPTNHLPSVAELRPTRPRTLPDKTDTTPTDNRQSVGERSFKHVWKIHPRQIFLPEHKPTPNRQNRINTDCKPISPRIWWFLSVLGRFRVVWPVWLG